MIAVAWERVTSVGADLLKLLGAWRTRLGKMGEHDLEGVCQEFPYHGVLEYYRGVGKKHAEEPVVREMLSAKAQLRATGQLAGQGAVGRSARLLDSYLDMLTDKQTGTFCYDTYIGTGVLDELAEGCVGSFAAFQSGKMTHLLVVLCDLIRFEVKTLLGQETYSQEHLLSVEARKQRVYYATWAIAMFSRYLSSSVPPIVVEQMQEIWKREAVTPGPLRPEIGNMALRVIDLIQSDVPQEMREWLSLIAMPVTQSHDEYLFMRVIQSFEVVFSLVAEGLRTAIVQIEAGELEAAKWLAVNLTRTLKSSLSIFRVLNTMSKEHFDSFRYDHDGASAIQSRQFKMIEVYAAKPSQERMRSAAFGAVPPVAAKAMQGVKNAEDVLRPYLGREEGRVAEVVESLREMDKAYVVWKSVHFKVAFKMIGELRGTGNTPGTPFLRQWLTAPLFPFLNA